MARKHRSAAQRAATKKLIAFNKAKRRRNPISPSARRAKRRTKNKRHHVAGYYPNPVGIKRVRRTRKGHHVVRHRARRRHNPIAAGKLRFTASSIMNLGVTSLQGAAGALLVNTALNYVPFLPNMLKAGNGKYLARAGAAVAVGVFGGRLIGNKMAANMAVGAMTVALHDLLLGLAAQAMPNVRLGDVGDYDLQVGAYLNGTGDQPMGLADQSMGLAPSYSNVYGQVGEYVAN